MNDYEVKQLADYCRAKLPLAEIEVSSGAAYPNLPLCIIDTIYSINVRYTSTQNTVNRFIEYFSIPEQFSVNEFLALYEKHDIEFMTRQVYQNAQRTSTRNGILKAEAVRRVAEILHKYDVGDLADVEKVINNPDFEAEYKKIPGQNSGVSLHYFYILVGVENEVKPDRMVIRFIEEALQRVVKVEECHPLLVKVCELLKADYPNLTPRSLDHEIWKFQRRQ